MEQCRNYLDVNVKDQLALVGRHLDQGVDDLRTQFFHGLASNMWSRNIAPLDEQGGKVSQEVVESLASSLLLGDELANRFEPHRGVGLEHSTVVD